MLLSRIIVDRRRIDNKGRGLSVEVINDEIDGLEVDCYGLMVVRRVRLLRLCHFQDHNGWKIITDHLQMIVVVIISDMMI